LALGCCRLPGIKSICCNMAYSWSFPVLVVGLQLAVATGDCPPGAKPFPSSLVGAGKISYANMFDIAYYDTYKVVTFSETLSKYRPSHPEASWQGQNIPPLVLYQCGTTRPSFGDDGITTSELRFFEIPVQKAAIGWTGPVPFFELLSVTETIGTIALTYVSSPCMQLLEECTPGVHVPNRDPNWATNASSNDVVFTDSWGTGWAGPDKDIPFQISRDPGTLQRAEWIRFIGAFFNEDVKADEIFTQIDSDYQALKAIGQQLSTNEGTEWGGRQPLVAWVSVKGWDRGQLTISNAYYKRDFVQDAGARLVAMPRYAPANCTFTDNSDGSKTLECEPEGDGLAAFKSFLAEADVIIDEQYIANHVTTSHDFAATYKVTAGEVPALARDPPNIFRLDGSVSDDIGAEGNVGTHWYELMPSQPQQLLAGLMEAVWGDSFHSPCGMKFLRRAIPGQGQTVNGDDDCPYHDAGGSHDCAAIHEHLHESPQCAKDTTGAWQTSTVTTTEATEADGAEGLSIASALAATAALWSVVA